MEQARIAVACVAGSLILALVSHLKMDECQNQRTTSNMLIVIELRV
jgi:hypothetical protein